MATLTKIVCPRCGGSGSYSFNHIHGTKCYRCDGSGAITADVEKLAKQKIAREKQKAKANLKMKACIEEGNRKSAERAAKYQDDPRIGPVNRARCLEFPLVAFEIYRGLDQFDGGANIHPSWVDRLNA